MFVGIRGRIVPAPLNRDVRSRDYRGAASKHRPLRVSRIVGDVRGAWENALVSASERTRLALRVLSLLAWGCAAACASARPAPLPTQPTQAQPEPSDSQASAVTPKPGPPPALVQEVEPEPRHGVVPLSRHQRELFWSSAEDSPPSKRGGIVPPLEDVSYVVGNERMLDGFEPVVAELGGGYVGVGSDQAYLLIGWQRPEFAWLVDYDAKVLEVHALYRAFFRWADSPVAFIGLFERVGVSDALAAIETFADSAQVERLSALYLRSRKLLRFRHRVVVKRLRQANVAAYLNEQSQFDFVREMVVQDRVRPMLANLLEASGFGGIRAAARALQVPIRVVYLSNAEEYWGEYSRQYRVNMFELPGDERTVVLRTILSWPVNRDYVYNWQSLENYRAWLKEDWLRGVGDIVHDRPLADPDRLIAYQTVAQPDPAVRAHADRRRSRRQARRKAARAGKSP